MVYRERPLFYELLWWLVTLTIFVRCWRLIARKIAELFRFHRAMSQFYEACGIDDEGLFHAFWTLASKTRSLGKKYDKR